MRDDSTTQHDEEMHNAIKKSDRNAVIKLLRNGASLCTNTGPEKDDLLDATRILVKNGAHVGQQIIKCRNYKFQTLSVDLMLPDALFFAYDSGHLGCLRYLLPYFGSPPLALLLFQGTRFIPEVFRKLFPVLAEWGPLPPGSQMLKLMRQIFDDPDKIIHQAIRDVFHKMHSSPCSLQHLCRGVIRKSYAKTAMLDSSQNLVQLITGLGAPPLVRDFMTMVPNKPLNKYVFDNPDLSNMQQILCGHVSTQCRCNWQVPPGPPGY